MVYNGDMNINELKYFVAVVKAKSLSKAANEMFISYQGLRKALKNLEAELGVPLFENGIGSGELSEYGKELYQSSKRILNEWNQFQLSLQRIHRQQSDIFHIGIAMGVDVPFLNFRNRLDSFLMEHENFVSIDAWDSYYEEKIESGELDLAITFGPVDKTRFDAAVLAQGNLAALVPAGHALFSKDRLKITDLRDCHIITVNRYFRNYDILLRACKEKGFNAKVILNTVNLTKTLKEYQNKEAIGISNTLSYQMEQVGNYKVIPFFESGTECQINIIKKVNQKNNPFLLSVEKELIRCLLK